MQPRKKLQYRLKEWRELRMLSQVELAKRVGCTSMFISLIERGRNQPSAGMLASLAQALDVPIDDLVADPAYQRETG